MKKVFSFVLTMFLMTRVCYGEINYTYEKKSKDVLKITEVETTVRTNEINITIKCLRDRIESLESQKANALEYYNENITRINERITFAETQIEKAEKLGVVEAGEVIE